MEIRLIQATNDYKTAINNLMQFYMYDFSEFVDLDVGENGLYEPYASLEDYWKEENHRFPYIIQYQERHIGFVLVRFIETSARNYFSIAEFFIMKKYRREGIGRMVAGQIFTLHRGSWEVFQKESNKPAQAFWHHVIDGYTKGSFTDRLEDGRRIQGFET